MRSMIVSLTTATDSETRGIDVERDDERLDVYVSPRHRQAPIAFLRYCWLHDNQPREENFNPVTPGEVRAILQFHDNLSRSQKKGRT